MKETFTFTAIVRKDGEYYVSLCQELDVTGQGETIEEAVSNLKEAVEYYIEKEAIPLPVKRPFMTTFEIKGQRSRKKVR